MFGKSKKKEMWNRYDVNGICEITGLFCGMVGSGGFPCTHCNIPIMTEEQLRKYLSGLS